jgi:multiple sugar transport system substrate-binding protein
LIVDHPMMGDVHLSGALADLKPLLGATSLKELELDALGSCLASYQYENCLYALPIDAAAPASSFRPELLERHDAQPPVTWDEMLDLARRGLVRMLGFPADLFLNFMGMCVSRGSTVAADDHLFAPEMSARSLEELRELAAFMPDSIYSMNPIRLYEAMASDDEFAYCLFAHSYGNYSRPGFAPHLLVFGVSPSLRGGTPMRTVLGSTGIAVSAKCSHQNAAVAFCLFVAGRICQTGIYGICGGQPANKAAWRDPLLNDASNRFFLRTIAGIESAYVRPRYAGYIALQRAGGFPIREYLRGNISADRAWQQLDNLYRQSLAAVPRPAQAAR